MRAQMINAGTERTYSATSLEANRCSSWRRCRVGRPHLCSWSSAEWRNWLQIKCYFLESEYKINLAATCLMRGQNVHLLTDKAENFIHQVLETLRGTDVIILGDLLAHDWLSQCGTVKAYLDLSDLTWKCPSLCRPSGRPHTHRSPSWKSGKEKVKFRKHIYEHITVPNF